MQKIRAIRRKGIFKNTCSKCTIRIKNSKQKRYCRKCHNEYMQEWRKKNPLTEIQRFKNNVRSKTRMRVKRGLLIKQPCETCGNLKVQAHHEDYSQPYKVKWLCKKCHINLHKEHKINIL